MSKSLKYKTIVIKISDFETEEEFKIFQETLEYPCYNYFETLVKNYYLELHITENSSKHFINDDIQAYRTREVLYPLDIDYVLRFTKEDLKSYMMYLKMFETSLKSYISAYH